MKLYEISEEVLEVISLYDNQTINEEELRTKLSDLSVDFNSKADNVASLIKALTIEINGIKEEIKKQQERVKQKEKKVNTLLEYLESNLKAIDVKKIETPRNVISFRKNPSKIILEDEKTFIKNYYGSEFVEATEVYKINKNAIKDKLKQGEIIEGATMVQDLKLNIK